MVINKKFKYIDLFSGIGGFHCAMDKYSDGQAKCILASEINPEAAKTYENHFGMKVSGDITRINQEDIKESYEVVCGGFPCQTFSKAGMQKGFGDPRGTLFKEIIRLVSKDKIDEQPKVLILENVRNLITHDNGITWNTIRSELEKANYNVIKTPLVVGPKDFGIPQLRERAIILAVRNDIYSEEIKLEIPRVSSDELNIYTIIDKELSKEDKEAYRISEREEYILNCWNDFINGIKYVPSIKVINNTPCVSKNTFNGVLGFPIWAFEFKKTYDVFNSDLNYQDWKKEFILKNRSLYEFNKEFIDSWLLKWKNLEGFTNTEKKFEWQCGSDYKSVWDGIIQFRTSGIRVKKPTVSPTLVAMVHVPIIGKYKRYITIKEAAALQSFPKDYSFNNESSFNAYKQLGNAVNVEVIYQVFKRFIDYLNEKIK